MNIEKEKLKLIRDYSFQIEVFNGVIQWFIGLFMAEIFFMVYLSEKTSVTLGLFGFAMFFLVALIVQTIKFAKRDAYIIEGSILEKQSYVSAMRDRPLETTREFRLQVNNLFKISPKLDLIPVNKKKDSYMCHYRVYEKFDEGYQGVFILSGSEMIFAVLNEVGTLSKEDLKISWKNKKVQITIITILLIISTGFLIATLMK